MANNELFRVETNILPKPKLVIVFCGLAFTLLISYIDQNSIGIALPTIGQDLNCANTIAWAGISSLIANTVFHVVYGRLADIFGRKSIFLLSVGLLALGDLLCGFAQTGPQLYGFRAISGVGTGGIGALTMMIVSDIVTLENRGKYQGILGACVGGGNLIGPFLAAALIEKATWRALFWCISPLAILSGAIVLMILPGSKVTGDPNNKVKAIDFMGITCSTSAIVLLLIPISGGGTYFLWSSPMVVSMLILGSISAVLFILTEWKLALMPMMPLRLYKNSAISALLIQNFLFGIVYYSHLYYLPIYYQNTRKLSPLAAAALTIPFVASQSILSILSGQYVSRTKRYGEVIWTGFGLWTLGDGLVLFFNRSLPYWTIVLILLVAGAGVGNVFQPTLVAAQAHSQKHDRAVVISVRNFLRSLGGAIGLALSSVVFSNVLTGRLDDSANSISVSLKDEILGSILSVPDLTELSATQQDELLDAYMAASKAVFLMWAPIMAACLLLCFLVKDRGLIRPGEDKIAESQQNTSISDGSVEAEGGIGLQAQQLTEMEQANQKKASDS